MQKNLIILLLVISGAVGCAKTHTSVTPPKGKQTTQACDPGPAPVFTGPTSAQVNQQISISWVAQTPLKSQSFTINFPSGAQIIQGSTATFSTPTAGVLTGRAQGLDICENAVALDFSITIVVPLGQPSIAINGGAAATTAANVALTINSANATQMYITNDSTCKTGGTWENVSTTKSWTLPNEGKSIPVYGAFRLGDTVSACVSAAIMYDKTPPVVAFVTTPAQSTTDTTAAFTFSATDAVSGVKSFNCALDGATLAPCQLNVNVTGLAIGAHTMNIQATDNLGNVSAVSTYAWAIKPTLGKPTILINNGAASTTNANVTLTLNGANATQMYITNDPTCASGGTLEPFSATKAWTLSAEGKAVAVYGLFKLDTTTSACVSAAIMYDKTAPTVKFVATPPASTSDTTANFTFSATDDVSGVKSFVCALDAATLAPCQLNLALTGLAVGSHTMSIQATDNLGNTSDVATYTWAVLPVLGKPTLVINGGAASTTVAAVTLTINPSNATQMYITNDPSCASGGTWENVATSKAWALGAEGKTSSVYGAFKLGVVTSSCISAAIMFDKTPPTIGFAQTPGLITTDVNANFVFTATDAVSGVKSFSCALDNAALAACPVAGVSFTNLALGNHAMNIQATDNLGNASTVQTFSWQIKASLGTPSIIINGGAKSTTNGNVTLTINGANATAMLITNDPACKGSGLQPIATTLPWVLSGEGKVVSVYGQFWLGDNKSDCVHASIMYDKTAPDISFVIKPPLTTNQQFANFQFSATDAVSGVKALYCWLDSSVKQVCPVDTLVKLNNLAFGSHTMSIQGEDNLGNISIVKTYTWTITAPFKPVTQNFVIDSSGQKVDILVVDDNSPSMTEEQHQMRKRFAHFIESLTGLDWQIGITTTDTKHTKRDYADGKLISFKGLKNTKIINPDVPNVEKIFLDTVYRHDGFLGLGASSDERGIYGILRALQRPENRPLFRPNSEIVSIIVTDEDERSSEDNLKPVDLPENLIKYFKQEFGDTNTYVNYSMIFMKETRKCPQVGSFDRGRLYEKLSTLTGGKIGDVCQDNYADTLKDIAEHVHQNAFTIKLQCIPIDGKVGLTYDPSLPYKVTSTLVGDELSLQPYPPVGTKVEATYICPPR